MRKSYSEQYAPYPSTINANHGYPSEEREHRTIFGLRPATFWLSIALFVVILLAAGLGGGIGGTAVENKNNQLQAARATIARLQSGLPANPKGTGTVTVTTGAATVTVTATPTSDCLKHANENYTAPSGVSYEMLCGTDLDASTLAIYFTGVTPNFEDCIDLCDSYNAYAGVRNITSINYNPTGSDGQLPGTCWCTVSYRSQMFVHIIAAH